MNEIPVAPLCLGSERFRLAALGACLVLAVGTAAQDGDDWAQILGAASERTTDTGVVGMTTDEMGLYLEAEQSEPAADEEVPESFVLNRRRFVVREMEFKSDWDADPTAVPALVDQFKRRTGMDAYALVPRKPLTFDDPELLDWPFAYMTAHYAFTLSEAEENGLRKFAERGGFIWADDCLQGQTFGPAFESTMRKLFPESEFKPIDVNDGRFGLVYKQKYTFSSVHESGIPRTLRNANPWCGVTLNGHLAVGYSPQDIGCGWEISSPPTPSNPLGAPMHSWLQEEREAAYRLGLNIMLYALLH